MNENNKNNELLSMVPGVVRSVNKARSRIPKAVGVLRSGVAKLVADLPEDSVRSTVSGSYTVAIISHDAFDYIGVAKRNPKDAPNALRGRRLAMSRALKTLVEVKF